MICVTNFFDPFILAIISKKPKFTSQILFGTQILLNKSSRVLQLPLCLSKLTINGW